MKKLTAILIALTLTGCSCLTKWECPYVRLTRQEAVYISRIDTIKAACFEDRQEVFIEFFTYNGEYLYSFVTFEPVHLGDTLAVTAEMIENIKIKRIK